jgi:hypothetical protein
MTLFNLMILAMVQGITEFLPISSSAHLILFHEIDSPTAEALALDVAVHLGSILAVVLYFRQDVWRAFVGLGQVVRGTLRHARGAAGRRPRHRHHPGGDRRPRPGADRLDPPACATPPSSAG